jgi:O-antigen/teichoic acid export membrane protein
MSRQKGFIAGLASSWASTLVTVAYSLVSVPLAIRYLSVEEFGLFMLLLQIAGYFTLIELGMAGATARILVDHKDKPESKAYGSVILTGTLVFAVQGMLILLIGLCGAPWIVAAVGVPGELQEVAIYLLRWLAICFAMATIFKMVNSILYANKRLDLLNLATGLSVFFGLIGMAVVLANGGGLKSLAGVFLLQTSLSIAIQSAASWRLRLWPKKDQWGMPSLARFKEMFLFAKDVFLVNLGNQILEASQLIIVTRTMGLTAAAMWSVGTKVFNLLYQFLTRIEGTAVVFFSEMMVRDEKDRLKTRFRQIYQISAGLAAIALCTAVTVNDPFVSLWAEPSLAWGMPLSAALAGVVFINVITRCNVDLILHTKSLLALRYTYFFEALAFVVLALLLAPVAGFYGVIGAAFVCVFSVRFLYTSWRVADYFQIPTWELCWVWLKTSLLASLALLPFVAISPLALEHVSSPILQLPAALLWIGLPAILLLVTIALPPDVQVEIRRFLPQRLASWISHIRRAC